MKKIIKGFLNLLSDKAFLKIKYFYHFKKKLNLKKPETYNEKIQWLKLYDRNESYPDMVDKYEAKKIIAAKVGEEYVIKSLGVWDKFSDIDFDTLPDKFVLKTTHDCGGVVICEDKATFDKVKAEKFLNRHLNYNYFYEGREWPYKVIKPRILAEEYMEDSNLNDLRDYKVFTFSGEPKALFVATERQSKETETKFDFYDMEFNHLPIKNGHPNSEKAIEKPENFEKMKELARKLSEGIPHVRVDFYDIGGKLYVGELTFYHYSGFVPFKPEIWDKKFGGYLTLPKVSK